MIDVVLDIGKHCVRLRDGDGVVEIDETDLLAFVTQLQKCVNRAHEYGWNLHSDVATVDVEPDVLDPPAEPAKPRRSRAAAKTTKKGARK